MLKKITVTVFLIIIGVLSVSANNDFNNNISITKIKRRYGETSDTEPFYNRSYNPKPTPKTSEPIPQKLFFSSYSFLFKIVIKKGCLFGGNLLYS